MAPASRMTRFLKENLLCFFNFQTIISPLKSLMILAPFFLTYKSLNVV